MLMSGRPAYGNLYEFAVGEDSSYIGSSEFSNFQARIQWRTCVQKAVAELSHAM